MIRLLRSQKGMTALEMLVAVAISVMVGAAIWSAVIFIDMQRVKSEIYGEMIGEVSQIFEKITFGYIPENDPNGERDGFRSANSYQVLGGGSELRYTLNDTIERRIDIQGNDVRYFEPNLFGAGSWEMLYDQSLPETRATTQLTFSVSPVWANALDVSVVLGRLTRGGWIYVSAKTSVSMRN